MTSTATKFGKVIDPLNIIEWLCLLVGLLIIFMSMSGNYELIRWTSIIGVAVQPLWIYMTYKFGQKKIMVLAIAYFFVYAKGVYTYWISAGGGTGFS